MTNKEQAEEFLNRIRKIESEIKDGELEIEALRYKASGAGAIRYDKDHVQTSPQNFMEIAVADIVELSQEVEEKKASVEEVRGNAYRIIRKMSDAEQRILLEWYYLNCVSIQEICNKMFKSERSIYYLRDDALESFGNILTNN